LIVFVRHGEAESYTDKKRPGLSEAGKNQIKSSLQKIAALCPNQIISSPTPRAYESALIIAGALGLPLKINKALAAIDTSEADVAGFLKAIETSRIPWQIYWKEIGWPGLETYEAYVSRIAPAIKAIIAKRRQTVIVGHSEMYQIIAAGYGINVALDAHVENACVIVFK